jgi:hypothetical protein
MARSVSHGEPAGAIWQRDQHSQSLGELSAVLSPERAGRISSRTAKAPIPQGNAINGFRPLRDVPSTFLTRAA